MTSPFADRDGAVGDPPEHYGDPIGEQRPLAAGTAIVDLSDRDVVSLTGPDRLRLVDSLTSQSLAGLAPGDSAETLLLDPSGRIEYAARVLDDGEVAWLLMDAGTGAGFAAFLDRMRFMLQVVVADRSGEFATVGTFGDAPAATAAPNGVPLVWVDPWGVVQAGGFQYAAGTHPADGWSYREALVERERLPELAGLPAAGTLALEALRIAAWRPRAATELDGTSLPHEFDWLRSAVHLAKGCYRGQETVAKVHNLGHPPRRLVMLHLDGSDGVLPAAGDEVRLGRPDSEGAAVGRVTAAAWHHELGPVALAILKRSADPASELTVVVDDVLVPAAQQVIVPPDAGATADVPRIPRLGAVRR
ncbi:CAF17-like 4Fe-4S cluster assembly/insertion protein YgfZ [Protaetiibacter mangrovi]|uniref:Folate-binding protein n=1 Tax=Protaetiibacter mangrovi TaxID=2970926 RepID=A0ABT1ZDM3_9MICO|nr:glycine cleavage T C-terminal barrel domain-containing protein [Protaetiibacter mangrovi]MCS0498785.1 folate-binding protein [Protaetiibacter mangrovi]TPX04993.1 folate-binding protein YgfZ [Schumannella luteola]